MKNTIKVKNICAGVAALTLLVAICAKGQTSSESQKANFCDVVSSPTDYDGKTLSVEVILQPSFHSLSLYDATCAPKEGFDITTQATLPDGWESLPTGKKLRGIIRRGGSAKVQLVGVFRSTLARGQDGQRFRFLISHINSFSKGVSKAGGPRRIAEAGWESLAPFRDV